MKNKILWTSVYLNVIALVLALASADSNSWIPSVVVMVTLAYLMLFAYANGDGYKKERKSK